MHLELVSYGATQPNTGLAATAATGDSLTMRAGRTKPAIIKWWAKQATTGFHRMTGPSLHDQTVGIKNVAVASEQRQWMQRRNAIEPQPVETLSLFVAGNNTSGQVDIGCMLLWNKDCPPLSTNAITYEEWLSRKWLDMTIYATLAGTTAGNGTLTYSGVETIISENDLLKANGEYALTGIEVDRAVAAVGIVGSDTSNLHIGQPGDPLDVVGMQDFYTDLAQDFKLPMIPVVQANNKANTNFFCLVGETTINPVIAAHFTLLKPKR